MASSAEDGTIRLWNTDGSERARILLEVNLAYRLAWSPDGRILASALAGDTIQLWNADGTARGTARPSHNRQVSSLAWSPDSRTLASASWDTTIRLWDADGMTRGRALTGHMKEVSDLSWSPDGAALASSSSDGTVRVWHLDRLTALTVASSSPPEITPGTPTLSGPVYVLTGPTVAVASVAWSPDGHVIVASAYDGILWWLNHDGSLRRPPLDSQTKWGAVLRWSPDGRLFAASGSELRLWKADGSLSAGPFGLRGIGERSLAWSSDNQILLAGANEHLIFMWWLDLPMSANANISNRIG